MFKEIWVDVNGFEGKYQVSNLGQVKSLPRKYQRREINLRGCPDQDGYIQVTLWDSNVSFTKKVHKLVVSAFHNNPENKPEVNHKDGFKSRNYSWNLEWATNAENMLHARLTGLNNNFGEGHGNTHLKNFQVLEIFNSKLNSQEIGEKYNVSGATVSRIKLGQCWAHITGKVYKKGETQKRWNRKSSEYQQMYGGRKKYTKKVA